MFKLKSGGQMMWGTNPPCLVSQVSSGWTLAQAITSHLLDKTEPHLGPPAIPIPDIRPFTLGMPIHEVFAQKEHQSNISKVCLLSFLIEQHQLHVSLYMMALRIVKKVWEWCMLKDSAQGPSLMFEAGYPSDGTKLHHQALLV